MLLLSSPHETLVGQTTCAPAHEHDCTDEGSNPSEHTKARNPSAHAAGVVHVEQTYPGIANGAFARVDKLLSRTFSSAATTSRRFLHVLLMWHVQNSFWVVHCCPHGPGTQRTHDDARAEDDMFEFRSSKEPGLPTTGLVRNVNEVGVTALVLLQ